MSDQAEPDLRFPAGLLRQVRAEQGATRGGMTVTPAQVDRPDHPVAGAIDELRAMRAQHNRLGNRRRELEAAGNEKLAP